MKRLRSEALAALATAVLLATNPAPDAPVADAAMRGDLEAVKALVDQGADVNLAQGDGMTALHWAAIHDHDELVKILTDAGANLEAGTRIGAHTPLHVASREGSSSALEALLAAGANVHVLNGVGVTPLHLAALAGTTEAISALLAGGAQVDPREPEYGRTPLMLAAAAGRTLAVTVLLQHGADVGAITKEINLVQRAAADAVARRARDGALDALRWKSRNPLTWRPTPSQVQAAVEAAKEVESRTASTAGVVAANAAYVGGRDESNPGFAAMVGVQGGLSALMFATREGHSETVAALLDGGAGVNQARPTDGTTPILEAAINGHYDLVLRLLERGADVDQASVHGATVLYAIINKQWAPRSRMPQPTYHQQQRSSYLEVMEALLIAGADPNTRLWTSLWYTTYDRDNIGMDYTGATPFWRAAYGTDVDAMALLLRYGADPGIGTVRPRGGRPTDPARFLSTMANRLATPVIVAAAGAQYGRGFAANEHEHKKDGWMPTMKFLVEEVHADVNAQDADGYSPLHYAAARGDNEMIQYLVDHGADVMAVARGGQTTVDMANGPVQRYTPFLETVALLEKMGAKNNHRCVSC